MRTIKAIGRGVSAAFESAKKPQQFVAADRSVTCSHCGGKGFKRNDPHPAGNLILPTTIYGLECTICHHLELFVMRPDACD